MTAADDWVCKLIQQPVSWRESSRWYQEAVSKCRLTHINDGLLVVQRYLTWLRAIR